MRMRKPLTEALKWYHEENKLSQEKDPAQEALKSQLQETLKEYTNLESKAYEIKILINRGIDLIVSGPARRIAPYFYYKFYKKGERYSKIASGNNPQFDDVATFTEILNQDLLDYIQKESLNIYVFDNLNIIELDMTSQDEARLSRTNKQIKEDLIGICNIPLQSLLINNLIQGEFPIFNMDNERVGKLAINIIWEEIQIGINTGLLNSLQFRTDFNQDNLIIKLANCLKEKALNIESAFNIFDIDKKNEISIDNFKNTLIFTLKFTTNQNEMEHLIRLFFTNQGRSKLDKIDFYKIFSSLLPASTSEQKYNTYNNIKIDPNMTTKTNDNNINNDSPSNVKQSQLTYNKNYFTANQLKDMTHNFEEDKKDRNLTELGALIVKYKFSKGKSKLEAVDLFKNIFDKDASLGIDKKELGIGFGKMGIELNENEKNNLWKKMGGSKGNIDFASFKAFHDNYCLIPNQSNQNTIVSNQNKTVSSGGFESETQIK
jgi:Ca2+-binding EF-hand superfamily protein